MKLDEHDIGVLVSWFAGLLLGLTGFGGSLFLFPAYFVVYLSVGYIWIVYRRKNDLWISRWRIITYGLIALQMLVFFYFFLRVLQVGEGWGFRGTSGLVSGFVILQSFLNIYLLMHFIRSKRSILFVAPILMQTIVFALLTMFSLIVQNEIIIKADYR